MTQLNFHNPSTNNPPRENLPVIQKLIAVYKLWHEFVPHIPKTSRYTLGTKIDELFLEVIELIFTASYEQTQEKIKTIKEANTRLGVLKFFLQICWETKMIDTKRYALLSEKLEEIGRILGGWKRGLETKLPAHKERGETR